jgi:hypothetical protein
MAVITPDTFKAIRGYVGVRLQQGVPIVDADENEREDIRRFELRAFLKWYVGNGVPEGDDDGFRIIGAGAANDFTIGGGPAAGTTDGLRAAGRCIVDGLDVLIFRPVAFTAQPLHPDAPDAAAHTAKLGVPPVVKLTTPTTDETVLVFLDVWERLVTPSDDPDLVLPSLGTESCSRIKREWVVRQRTGTTVPGTGDPQFAAGHSYYPLASIARFTNRAEVRPGDVTDLRERRLLLPPATLVKDVLGVDPLDYRRGQGRPAIDLRSAVNALLRGELPTSADVPVAPGPTLEDTSQEPIFDRSGRAHLFFSSDRTGGQLQVYAVRWDPAGDLTSLTTSPPMRITQGPAARAEVTATALPDDDLVVAYLAEEKGIQFRRASFEALPTAAENPVGSGQAAATERTPQVVRSGRRLIFFYTSEQPAPRWLVRVREYTPTWSEQDAVWRPANELLPVDAGPGESLLFAAVDPNGQVWATFTVQAKIHVVRFDPATAAVEDHSSQFAGTAASSSKIMADGTSWVWVFWTAGTQVHFRRLNRDASPPTWESTVSLPTAALVRDAALSGVRDPSGTVWLCWMRRPTNTGGFDVVLSRFRNGSNTWETHQINDVGNSGFTAPLIAAAPGGPLLVVWGVQTTTTWYDLHLRQVVTAL